MLVIFDLDGVLVHTAHIHTDALHKAVTTVIPHHTMLSHTLVQLNASDGIRTRDKLTILKKQYSISESELEQIDLLKEELTYAELLNLSCNPLYMKGFKDLKSAGYTTAIASNTRRKYVDAILSGLGLFHYIDYSIAGDEVVNGKPDPECFIQVMKRSKHSPSETTVIEDSDAGIAAANASGAHRVVRIDPRKLITYEQITELLTNCDNTRIGQHGY